MKKDNKTQQVQLSQYLDPRLDDKIIALPLEFEYLPVEIISKQFTKLNSPHPYRIHYLGPRFTNTLVLHKKYSGSSPANQNSKETHLFEEIYQYQKYEVQMRKIVQSNYLNEKLQDNHYYKSAIFYRAFEGMNPTLNRKEQFLFNSCFEAGNLDCVIKVQPMQFDLFLRIDSNTRGHTQWFYFSVQNGQKIGNVTFNICNLTKPRTLYEQGMRPYVFSKKLFQKNGKKWEQSGNNVELIEKKLRYSLIEEMIDSPCVYKLSFQYCFEEEDDQVFFAYSIPYTYSQMLKDISLLPQEFVKKNILGRSLTGVEIPILHITNHQPELSQKEEVDQKKIPQKKRKKNVLITGRIHPGQSNGSHVLNGFIKHLCGNSQSAKQLRNRMNFFIIPMINPDGVIMGNSRSSASGKDLNRQYLSTKKQLYPQVHLVKNLAFRLQKNEGLMMFFDFHGHSRKKNTFFYGPGYPISEPQYYKSRAFAKIIEKFNSSFRYYSCSFMISEQKKRTARAVLFEQIKIPYVFTIQSSIGLYYDVAKLKTLEFTIQQWENIGGNIAQGLSDFIVAYQEYEEIIRERRLQRKRRKQRLAQAKKANGKKFIEQDPQIQEVGTVSEKKNQSLFMFEMMEEIKQQVPSKNQANMDPEASSDDHDDAEDMETSKLAEFNNLVIYSKQKDQMNNPSRMSKIAQDLDESFLKPKKLDTQNDEMQLIKEIVQQGKTNNQKGQSKLSQGPSQTTITTNNIQPKIGTNDRNMTRKNVSYGSKSMKLTEQQTNPKLMREQCKQRKSINFQTHRHLISKQFFPLQKCQIVELPKSSMGNRKDIKKGRVMIEDYLNDKLKQKQEKQQKIKKQFRRNKFQGPKTDIIGKRKISYSSVDDRSYNNQSVGRMKKFRIEDLQKNKINARTSSLHNKFIEKRVLSLSHTASNGNSAPNSATNQKQMRIFDTVLFSGFQGMEIDNMAMMIKTFNHNR